MEFEPSERLQKSRDLTFASSTLSGWWTLSAGGPSLFIGRGRARDVRCSSPDSCALHFGGSHFVGPSSSSPLSDCLSVVCSHSSLTSQALRWHPRSHGRGVGRRVSGSGHGGKHSTLNMSFSTHNRAHVTSHTCVSQSTTHIAVYQTWSTHHSHNHNHTTTPPKFS